ncbi:HD domain-containing protein [uncultured Ligilactobacillus sp.]|uniref:HD domain-containing protein n=1 Tax=uncultured Ligilactobacillus sp. TaxID=2837633 RepID=UPI00272B3998|nr:HD domain-containing protein [uncultured Ligilactobacillus sp.]
MDQTQQLTQLHTYTYEKLSHDHTGHDMAHIERVVKMARTLNKKLGGNSFVVQAAALLHDVIDEKLFTDIDQAKASVIAQMQALRVSQSDQDHIMEIISKMSFSHSLAGKQELSLEGQIVQDADWLDAIGAIGIARAIYYGARHEEKLYDPAMPPRKKLDKTAYRDLSNETIINHFYEKLFKIKDMLNTAEAKAIAKERHELMVAYVTAFKADW